MSNCKPGDLAIVVGCRVTPEMIGAIVEVVGGPPAKGAVVGGLKWMPINDELCWLVKPISGRIASRSFQGNLHFVPERIVADCLLRPIRANDADDETLTWAGKPNESPADVIAEAACSSR